MLFGYDKEHFITLPTPIQHLPAISAMTGCEFFIKRDDMTDLGMGGNKLRKLEYHERRCGRGSTKSGNGCSQTGGGGDAIQQRADLQRADQVRNLHVRDHKNLSCFRCARPHA